MEILLLFFSLHFAGGSFLDQLNIDPIPSQIQSTGANTVHINKSMTKLNGIKCADNF